MFYAIKGKGLNLGFYIYLPLLLAAQSLPTPVAFNISGTGIGPGPSVRQFCPLRLAENNTFMKVVFFNYHNHRSTNVE